MMGLTCTVQCQGIVNGLPQSHCCYLYQHNNIKCCFLFPYRARFESLCFTLFQQSLSAIDRVLATSHVAKDKVDQVMITGMSSWQIPVFFSKQAQ